MVPPRLTTARSAHPARQHLLRHLLHDLLRLPLRLPLRHLLREPSGALRVAAGHHAVLSVVGGADIPPGASLGRHDQEEGGVGRGGGRGRLGGGSGALEAVARRRRLRAARPLERPGGGAGGQRAAANSAVAPGRCGRRCAECASGVAWPRAVGAAVCVTSGLVLQVGVYGGGVDSFAWRVARLPASRPV